jgi:hypothetical protein
MKKFKVMASYITYCTAEIEAESQEEAEQIARNMDGGEFEADAGDDWIIDDVLEVE